MGKQERLMLILTTAPLVTARHERQRRAKLDEAPLDEIFSRGIGDIDESEFADSDSAGADDEEA